MGCLDVDQAEHEEAKETRQGQQEAATRIAGASPDFLLAQSRFIFSGLLTAQEAGSTPDRHSMRAAAQRTWSAMQLQHKPLSEACQNTSSPAGAHRGTTCQLDKPQVHTQEQHRTGALKATKPQTAGFLGCLLSCWVAHARPGSQQHAGCLACRQQPARPDSFPAAVIPAPQLRMRLQQDPAALPQPACNTPPRLQYHGQGQQGSPAICRPAAGCGRGRLPEDPGRQSAGGGPSWGPGSWGRLETGGRCEGGGPPR